MDEHTHAPGWRGRSRITGPIHEHATPFDAAVRGLLLTGSAAIMIAIIWILI
jgi:hypothetical protein